MVALGAGAPLCYLIVSYRYIARLNFIHTDHTALSYRSIEPPPPPPIPNHLPIYASDVCIITVQVMWYLTYRIARNIGGNYI